MFSFHPRVLIILLLKGIKSVVLFIISVMILPVLIVWYLLCWIRAKLTAVSYGYRNYTLLSGMDVLTGIEVHSANSNINCFFLIQDHISVQYMKNVIMSKFINAKDDQNRPSFPKMSRCLTVRAGYLMWTDSISINIDDHVKGYNGQPLHDEAELKDLVINICNAPLSPSKPSWEVLIIPLEYTQTKVDTRAPHTCILLRIHHSIVDGVSLTRMLVEGVAEANIQMKTQPYKKPERRFRNSFVVKISMFIRSIQTLLLTPTMIGKQLFNKKQKLSYFPKLNGKMIYDWTSPIKWSIIKDIKNITSTSVNEILVSCLAGALRKHFLKQRVQLPHTLHCRTYVSSHSPHEPNGFTNKFAIMSSQMPIGEMDCLKRLKTTKMMMNHVISSPNISSFRGLVLHCCDIIPWRMLKWILSNTPDSVAVSNIPGPVSKVFLNQSPIDSIIPLAQIRDYLDISVLAFSYAGEMTVSVTVDRAFISQREDVQSLLGDFIDEIHQLHNSINV